MSVIPTGELHKVDVEDLFFSTTDRKGVILLANHVFAYYARHDYDELVGAPHNIIRHPAMPGGAFRVVWRMLQEGRSTCAYVLNLAGDGSAYWAFATLAPIGDHYISVRSSPCQDEVREPLQEVYARVRAIEVEARENGKSAAQAAEIGEQALLAELAELGFGSYEDFLRVVVPAEVAARQLKSKGIPEPAGATGVLKRLNEHAVKIHRQVSGLGVDLTSFENIAHRLGADATAAETAVATLGEALRHAAEKAEALAERAPLVASAAKPLSVQCDRVVERLDAVVEHVAAVRDGRSELRFSVALAQLQAEMIGRYTVAVLDGSESAELSDQAIRELVATVDEGLTGVNHDLTRNTAQAKAMTDEIDSASSVLRLLTMSMTKWRELVDKFGLSTQLEEEAAQLDESLAAINRHLESLAADSAQFSSGVVKFDMDEITSELNQVMTLAGYTRSGVSHAEQARTRSGIPSSGGSHLDRLLS